MVEHRPVTIKDVAKQAGVAVSTVSRVLNGLDRVSQETRDRVMKAVEVLGYVQSNLAVSMITGQTRVVMILVPDFINDFYASVIQGAEHYLKTQGYMSMICSTYDTDLSAVISRFSCMIDGAIVIPDNSDITEISIPGKPIILADRYAGDGSFPAVITDDRKGVQILTRELLERGHQKIGIIVGKQEINVCRERLAGYLDVLEEYGVEPRQEYQYFDSMYQECGYFGIKKLLALPTPPTAVIACNNLICIGCLRALAELDCKIGVDISLVGFDDHPLAANIAPGITVISRPTLQMGEKAAELLVRRLNGEAETLNQIILDVELIRRGSIADLN